MPIAFFASRKALAAASDRGFAWLAMGIAALEAVGLAGAAAYLVITGLSGP